MVNIVTLMLFVIFRHDIVREKGALDVDYNYCIKISLQKCYLFRSRVVVNMVFGSLREEVTGRF